MRKQSLKHIVHAATVVICSVQLALANPPPPRQRDPISLDPFSPSNTFGTTWSDLYGDNPVPPGMGWDVGGPGPVLHVVAPAYGVMPIPDNTDAISNGEFRPNLQQVIYFSVDDTSAGFPGVPVRGQFIRRQHAGDRYVLNGRSSVAPAIGPFPAVRVGGIPGPRHLLSANQTAYNEIPSIPPPAFSAYVPPAGFTAMDDMDGLELNPIDLNGDLKHDTWIYFSLAPGSPTLGAFGASAADILVAPPGAAVAGIYAVTAQMGLQFGDDIDGLAVFENRANPRIANPGIDFALFSLARGSPSLVGPDGVAGTADDISPADVLVTNFAGGHTVFMQAATIGLLFTDNIDGLDVEPFLRPEVFDWWVQRFNIDVVFRPPPNWPPTLPANDLHVILPGVDVEQVFDLWTGSFPNAQVVAIPTGVSIDWSGANFLPGQVAHIGWSLSELDTLPNEQIQIIWTRDGQPIPQPVPDSVQRWTWDGTQLLIDRLPNLSQEPVLVQRRINRLPDPVSMQDLLIGSRLWETAQIIDPQPMPLMPDSFFDVFFEIDLPGQPETRTFSVMYDVFNTAGQRLATHLNAVTMVRTPELENEGACCFATHCEVASEEFCLTWGGHYLGLGVPCQGVTCTPVLKGDMNCDGVVDFKDINPFVAILSGAAPCNAANADTNCDNVIDFKDINPFVALLSGGTPCQ